MDLMSKYLGIIKCNHENISGVFIATDANIQGVNADKLSITYRNKMVSTVDGQINENFTYANIPDKSDKTTAQHDNRLPDLNPIVSAQTFQKWDREMQDLIEWYRTAPKLTGPSGARARMGSLQGDLQRLRAYSSGEEKTG